MAAVQQMPSVPTGVPRQATVTNDVMDVREPEGPSSGSSAADPSLDASVPMSGLAIGSKFGSGPQRGDTRIAVIVYGRDQEEIVSVFAEVLGKPFCKRPNFEAISIADQERVIGIYADNAKTDIGSRNQDLVVAINAHCVSLGMPPDILGCA